MAISRPPLGAVAPVVAIVFGAVCTAANPNIVRLSGLDPAASTFHRMLWALPLLLLGGKLNGQKPPLKLKENWAIRIRLQIAEKHRDLTLFNLAIDSKLRGYDLVSLRLNDGCTRTNDIFILRF